MYYERNDMLMIYDILFKGEFLQIREELNENREADFVKYLPTHFCAFDIHNKLYEVKCDYIDNIVVYLIYKLSNTNSYGVYKVEYVSRDTTKYMEVVYETNYVVKLTEKFLLNNNPIYFTLHHFKENNSDIFIPNRYTEYGSNLCRQVKILDNLEEICG